jgi:DNA replication protein DnaC
MNHDLLTDKKSLMARASALKLHGLLAHWDELTTQDQWIFNLLTWEETERQQRGLERRLRNAHIGRFKPLVDFDWDWPEHCDREAVEELMKLAFIEETGNAILIGPNGIGKSMVAKNIAYQAVLGGHSVLFTTAGEMLNTLAALDGDNALRRRLKYYAKPALLLIDEVGYLSYSNRHADLLFEVISRRYEEKSTLITTNKPFAEWGELFPNASCVVSLVDRLVHHAEIIPFEGGSYRLKEAKEQAERRKKQRSGKTKTGNKREKS